MSVKFYDRARDTLLKYAVIIAKYQDTYVWVRAKTRSTWEIPGGKREIGETILECAKRELYEERGAVEFSIQPLSVYSVVKEDDESFGMLYIANITKLIPLPESEISEINFFTSMPTSLTYPEIQPFLFEYMLKSSPTK